MGEWEVEKDELRYVAKELTRLMRQMFQVVTNGPPNITGGLKKDIRTKRKFKVVKIFNCFS